jgi:hypothetical protein
MVVFRTSVARPSQLMMELSLFLQLGAYIPFGVTKIPYLFVADDAFALKPNVMKPYPQQSLIEDKRIYNYRHSRARRISENLFVTIANRWRVIRGIILLPPEKIESVIMAILILHNYLEKHFFQGIILPCWTA